MEETSAAARAFKFLSASVQRIQGHMVYLRESSGVMLQLSGNTLAQGLRPGQDVVLVAGRSEKLYRVFSPGTGDLFCKPATGRVGKIALGVLFGLTGGVPVLGPMIVAGVLIWVILIYFPKAIFGEPYARWQLVWGLGGLAILYAALILEDAALLHMISAITALCASIFYYWFLGLFEKVVDEATLTFSRSSGLTSSNVMKRVPVFVSPTRDWKVVVSKS